MTRIARRLGIVALLAAVAPGCGTSAGPNEAASTTANKEIELKLLVVDDPRLAEAVERLRAEWKARSSATVSIEQRTAVELIAADSPPADFDAIIYPSGQIGLLAQRGWIAPLPADFAANQELAWSDTFELAQVAETRWGPAPFAVPFGSAMLTCYYRADLFARFHKRPPRTWSEYHALAEFFSRRENLSGVALAEGWHGAVEPLAASWAGRVLLARAAAYAKHRDHYSTLFEMESMRPLISGPPFVRALEELVADARLGPPGALERDPAAARREFLDGRAAIALALPGHASVSVAKSGANQVPTGFAEPPGSLTVYDFAGGVWEARKNEESPHVALLCFSGRLGSVSVHARNARSSFQLLAWLSGREWGTSVAGASAATTLYRRSQMRTPQPWLDPYTDADAARQYAEAVRDYMGRQAYLFVPRIAGGERYLAALDTAVAEAVRGDKSPTDALADAAAEWARITSKLGLEAQRKAYRASLGLEP
jgi:multiple sugar transport system substrate-binding protein